MMVHKMLEASEYNKNIAMQLLKDNSELSQFDVNMSFSAAELKDISGELAESTNCNMMVVDETLPSEVKFKGGIVVTSTRTCSRQSL